MIHFKSFNGLAIMVCDQLIPCSTDMAGVRLICLTIFIFICICICIFVSSFI